MNSRPIGITILAILSFLSVIFYCVVTVDTLANRAQVNNLLQGMSGGGAGPSPLQGMGAILPAYFLLMALFTAALGWGFWTLKNWARIISLVIIGVSVIGGGVEIVRSVATVHGWSQRATPEMMSAFARLFIAILVFLYLNSSRVRTAFRPAPPSR